MTNDELLSGFLDRSLSEDQLLEFEARRNADASFAHETHDMLAVEKLLVTATPVVTPPVDFLTSVESTVAAKVAAGTSAGGFVSGLASSVWTWIAGACLVVVGGYFIMNSEQQFTSSEDRGPKSESVTTNSQQQIEQRGASSESISSEQRGASSESLVTNSKKQVANSKQRTEISAQPTAERLSQSNAERSVSPTSVDVMTQNSDRALEALLKDLQACRASGDHVRCSQIALNVGRTYRMRGATEDAEEYLTLALTEARTARLIQFEIEANGELGLAAQAKGRITDAKERFAQAVALGTKNGIPTEKWTKALKSIQE